MRRIHELEAWSAPGKLLPVDYGKLLAQELWDLGVSRDVYLGLNVIPDETDVENLRLAIEAGELDVNEFELFCKNNSLMPNLNSIDSACKFLEHSLGRRLAWIHLPENSSPNILATLIGLLHERGHIVVDPDNLEEVI